MTSINWYSFFGLLDFALVFSIMSLGVYITFRLLNFPDLTVDGSFPLGAAIASAYLTHHPETHSFVPLALSFVGGALAGTITALLYLKLRILPLLASIITMTLLYSVNLRIMDRPNISLMGIDTLFQYVETLLPEHLPPYVASTIIFGLFALGSFVLLALFLRTEMGLALRATGENQRLARAQGIDISKMTLLGLALSNALVALSGALYAESQRSADVGMGTGMIIAGLVSVIIGEGLLPKRFATSMTLRLSFVLVGSFIYRAIIAMALSVDTSESFWSFRPSDLNFITAAIVVVLFALQKRPAP